MKKIKHRYKFLLVCFLATVFINCSDSDEVKVQSIKIMNIEAENILLERGDTKQIEVQVLPQNAERNGVTYKTDNAEVFTVSALGVITAVSPGEGTLLVKSQDGTLLNDSRKVKIVEKIINIATIEFEDAVDGVLKVSRDIPYKVALNFTPIGANEGVKYESSNKTIFTIDDKGMLLGIAAGDATLTVSAANHPNIKKTCTVRVEFIAVESVTMPEKLTILSETTHNIGLNTIVVPDNASNYKLQYSSSDETIATIDLDGLITPLKPGVTTITAKTTDGTNKIASSLVTVSPELYRRHWDVTCSSQNIGDGGGAMKIVQDDSHDQWYWHSDWGNNTAQLPHWLLIDMKEAKSINKILLGRRLQDGKTNKDTRFVKVAVSEDNDTFTDVGVVDFGDSSDLDKYCEFAKTVTTRYIKLTITESNRAPFANMAIFKAYLAE